MQAWREQSIVGGKESPQYEETKCEDKVLSLLQVLEEGLGLFVDKAVM